MLTKEDLYVGRTVWIKDHTVHGDSGNIVYQTIYSSYQSELWICIDTGRALKSIKVEEDNVFLTSWALKIAKSKSVQQSITRLTQELSDLYSQAQTEEQQQQKENVKNEQITKIND